MTELLEMVDLNLMLTDNAENYCGYKEAKPKPWKCRVSGLAGAEPTAKRLLKSMKKHDKTIPEKPAPGKMGQGWDLEKCTKTAFPFQTHHLIPKKHLPTHKVCTWLAKAYDKNVRFQITADNNYDTDHANNGYCMPFASTTLQWKEAGGDVTREQMAAFAMMDKIGIQLHQGSHSYEGFGGEQEQIESKGYLEAVDELLDRIHRASRRHVIDCKTCNQGKEKPNVLPFVSVVRHMDQASRILKTQIDSKKIWVSAVAYQWSKQH